jgi:prophage antirepressor-like protein
MQEESKCFQTFFYHGNQIRTVEHHGETWWMASDVCKVLDIENVAQSVARLDNDDICSTYIIDSLGRKQETLIVNEPGLYTLILGSRKPEAKSFKRWVTHEVIPSIRKTGSYSLAQEEPQAQPSQWLNWDAALIATLSKDEHMRLIRYERARLSYLESAYDFKYPQSHNNQYPQSHNDMYPEEKPGPRPIETLVLPAVETKPDLHAVLMDYLRKTGSTTVRYLQQSGPRSLRNLPANQLRAMLQALVANGAAKVVKVGKTEEYQL